MQGRVIWAGSGSGGCWTWRAGYSPTRGDDANGERECVVVVVVGGDGDGDDEGEPSSDAPSFGRLSLSAIPAIM